MRYRLFVLAVASLLLSGCIDLDSRRYEASFHHSYSLSPGGRIAVDGFNGAIEVMGWDQDNVDISGTKYASSQAVLDQLKVEIQADSGAIAVRTVRPGELFSNSGVSYVIRIPRGAVVDHISSSNGSIRVRDVDSGARLRTSNGAIRGGNLRGLVDAETSNGSIEIDGIDGDVVMHTSNGRIQAENIRGECRAHTSNGPIEITFARSPENGVRAETTNGGITLHLPADTAARLQADTSNSSISTELDVNGHVRAERNHLEGLLGAGGPLIELSTSNGHISLVKS